MPWAHGPTPLEPAHRLRAALGGPDAGVPQLWIKREDQSGLAVGGNKVRALAYLLADAQAQGARKVVSFGGLQSNFLSAMASACARTGMEAHCLYFERRPKQLRGNLLLAQLMGARLHFVALRGGAGPRSMPTTTRLVSLLARLHPGIGPRAQYFIPVGGHTPLGCLGYVTVAQEVVDQAGAAGFRPHAVVAAAGSGGMMAGLLAGFRLLEVPISLVGVDVGHLWTDFEAGILDMAARVTALLGTPRQFGPADLRLHPGYGPGYARPFPPAQAAVELAARHEGLLLDPVYTGKALAALIQMIQAQRFQVEDHVVFVHSGGLPALFAPG